MKTVEFAKTEDPAEAIHYEPPHLEVCLSSLSSQYDIACMKLFLNFADLKFCCLLFGALRVNYFYVALYHYRCEKCYKLKTLMVLECYG